MDLGLLLKAVGRHWWYLRGTMSAHLCIEKVTCMATWGWVEGGEPRELAFLFSGSPQGRNKEKSYLQSWKTAGGGRGGRGGSWAERSSKNWPSPLSVGKGSPCSRVRPTEVRVPTAEEAPGEDWGGQSCPGPGSSPAESQLCSQAQPHVTLARHLHKRATEPGDDQGLPSPPPQSYGAEAAWY